jgi:hypothetical protein
MANGLYTHARDLFLAANAGSTTDAKIDWVADSIKACLVGVYTVNLSTHMYFSQLTGVITPATGVIVPGRSVIGTSAGGAANAAGLTFGAATGTQPPSGATVNYVVVYKDTGTASTSPLILFFDGPGGGVTGLPLTTTGQDVQVAWPTATPYIFTL